MSNYECICNYISDLIHFSLDNLLLLLYRPPNNVLKQANKWNNLLQIFFDWRICLSFSLDVIIESSLFRCPEEPWRKEIKPRYNQMENKLSIFINSSFFRALYKLYKYIFLIYDFSSSRKAFHV